ncbi:MAG: glucuronate isomerase [Chitinophagaceae bacterium]
MKPFLDETFLLKTPTAQRLFEEFARDLPIIDYHCHLPCELIWKDNCFENLTQPWLSGDHYKWRAMRANGVEESYCTGNQPDHKKFEKWAQTVPYTMRNPLYHWTHLELQRYFGIHQLLNGDSAREIYATCSHLLNSPEYSTRNLLRKMKVQLVCTTDDPADSLEFHGKLRQEGFEIPILPAFRADKAMQVEVAGTFNQYLLQLESAADQSISTWQDFLDALKNRHDFFASMGCCISDHGLEEIYASDFTLMEISQIFNQVRSGHDLEKEEIRKFKSALLLQLAEWDAEKNWVQQFHLGALRNNNSRLSRQLGPDTGWDSMGDFSQAKALSGFLDQLDLKNRLARTILYNVNPKDNEVMATMTGNFNDGSVPGKIQWGSAWWFLDQQEGMTRQLNALSNMGLLSRFVGMVTDSRSFLSYPRHEYFRRILCNLFGGEIENGELPADFPWIGKLIQDICYHNARNYFNWGDLVADKKTPEKN